MTEYKYDPVNRLTKLIAPGGETRTWTYWYNALGQPTEVLLPNGMMTVYDSDEDHQHRMTTIGHSSRSPLGASGRF